MCMRQAGVPDASGFKARESHLKLGKFLPHYDNEFSDRSMICLFHHSPVSTISASEAADFLKGKLTCAGAELK